MKERPILFSGEMVRAILDGRKTQTRRMLHIQPESKGALELTPAGELWYIWPASDGKEHYCKCRYGTSGDRLWVRETWAHDDVFCKDVRCGNVDHIWWQEHEDKCGTPDAFVGDARWRPSIFMPRWASRITLEIVNIRVEQLQEITESDVIAEGIKQSPDGYWLAPLAGVPNFPWNRADQAYAALWETINGKGSWNLNPWVWMVEFNRVEVNDAN